MPQGRLRQGHDQDFEKVSSKPLVSHADVKRSKLHGANSKLLETDNEPAPTMVPFKDKRQPKPEKVVRKGRPRLYSAQVIEDTDDTFIVRIKFNVRNKLARRLFGIFSPVPPPMEKLSRLRPPSVNNAPSKNYFPDKETVSGQNRSRRQPSQTENDIFEIVKKEPTLTNTSSVNRRLGIRKAFGHSISDQRSLSTAVKGLVKYSINDLPYLGALPFPRCIINDTDPTASDRELFNNFFKQATEKHANFQQYTLAFTNDEESPSLTPIPQNASHYYSRSQIQKVQFREYLIDTWYSSPYPEEYSKNKVLYICEFCLKYMRSPESYLRHQLKSCNCYMNHPPGTEIYRDPEAQIAFWEVDGRKNTVYCQRLCLLAKLFLNSKTLYYDVEPFIFYILTEIDEQDSSIYHFVGYFSKEKLNNSDYNVSCILTLPIYQRKGYGSLMIDFSHLLSKREFKYGSPEKPLSDLGLISYRKYWKVAVALALRRLYDDFLTKNLTTSPVTLEIMSQLTGMKPSDIVFALENLEALSKNEELGTYAITIDLKQINDVIGKWYARGYVKLCPDNLFWKPLIYGPSGGINSTPALGFVPQPGSQPATISNSISMITEFLKDDINNPYSLEEEAYKLIQAVIENSQSKESQIKPCGYHICRPHSDLKNHQISLPRVDDIKLANIDTDEEIEAENSEFGSDFEQLSEADDNIGYVTCGIDSKLSDLVQEGHIISAGENESISETHSEIEGGDHEYSEKNGDGKTNNNGLSKDKEAEAGESIITTRIISARNFSRSTRSQRKPVKTVLLEKGKRRKVER